MAAGQLDDDEDEEEDEEGKDDSMDIDAKK